MSAHLVVLGWGIGLSLFAVAIALAAVASRPANEEHRRVLVIWCGLTFIASLSVFNVLLLL